MISINASTKHTMKKKVVKKTTTKASGKGAKGKKDAKRGSAPPLQPKNFNTPESIAAIVGLSDEDFKNQIDDIVRQMLGGSASLFGGQGIGAPRTASTTMDRQGHAADLATIVKEKGTIKVLKKCGVLQKIEMNLLPNGIGAVFGNEKGTNHGGGMRKITSRSSLASMGSMDTSDNIDTASTIVSDSKRGKTVPPEAREGCLLFIRALAEIVGKTSEPFVVPLLAAALEECSSSASSVRDAAEDTATKVISIVNGHAVSSLVFPVLFEALQSPDWRVKACAMQKMVEVAEIHPRHVSRLLPKLVPVVTAQVWDTKPQVTKAAKEALLACCMTNINPDVAPAIPAVVDAICKPNDTSKAIDELKATTFVATVDASTLSILCPVLSRGLKDKMALNKRSCCVVIENMSRLVETPDAVAPFGPLLVPELNKVAENVQFEEIRDCALAALNALTKALGHADIDSAMSSIMKEESERIAAEQKRIEDERAAEQAREEELARKEEEERKLWKEAMEAQRQLNALALKEEEEKKAEEKRKKEIAKKGTKTGGKCQGCGLKKCKKSCLFYSG